MVGGSCGGIVVAAAAANSSSSSSKSSSSGGRSNSSGSRGTRKSERMDRVQKRDQIRAQRREHRPLPYEISKGRVWDLKFHIITRDGGGFIHPVISHLFQIPSLSHHTGHLDARDGPVVDARVDLATIRSEQQDRRTQIVLT